MADVTVEVRGLEEAMARLSPAALRGPFGRFLKRTGVKLQALLTERSPVDTGRLQTSLAFQVDGGEPPTWVKVGSNVAADGFGYPVQLDESDWTHYVGTQWAGEPTKGWFSATIEEKGMPEVERLVGILEDELAKEMNG